MMRDVRRLPRRMRQQLPHPEADFICDACQDYVIATGAIDEVEFIAALGAPADHVAKMRQRVEQRRERRASHLS